MITKEQETALHELECNTHSLWSPEAANKLTAPFGFVCHSSQHFADGGPDNPKGLTLRDGVAVATGASSWSISGQIVSHFRIKSKDCLGRGFQVRADCEAIREHLNAE